MTKNDKYTILVDANFFLHKVFHIAKRISNGNFDFKQTPKADKNLLLWKLSQDFAAEIKRFDSITDSIVYCIDGSSWRKHYFEAEEIEAGDQVKYKGNRKKSDDIDWSLIYKTHSEFADALKKLGVSVVRLDGCEADDLIFAYSSILNAKGKNALIISGDNDLIQLVNHDSTNGTNTLYYNKFLKSLYAYPGFTEWLDNTVIQAVDIFDMPIDIQDNSKDNLKTLVKSIKATEVNTQDFQFKKILFGDAGDNVKPIYSVTKIRKSGKNKGQEYISSIGPAKVEQILSDFKEKYPNYDEVIFWNKDVIRDIASLIHKYCPDSKQFTIAQLEKNYCDNRNLMILHEKALPTPIYDSMVENIESNAKKVLAKTQINIIKSYDSILEQTDYEATTQKKQSSAGFFGSFNLD